MSELFAGQLLHNAQGERVDATEALEGKRVALYFSAHWCPPCQQFTPILKDFYDSVNEDEKKVRAPSQYHVVSWLCAV